ncbi:unnamed protein product [Eruca vesicaria subsp. sativa]|uniref:Uncharacterized protein n=1 Tax=Eruca vesicaria subsp. sativa TaxID=29727 RepID=A0ABC8JEF0_ERUVS|nr:unnamed protein product [Eruca vesicaria subsp. sativa]
MVSTPKVVKSHPGHMSLSSSPPPCLKASFSASPESNFSVLLIISSWDMYIRISSGGVITHSPEK